MICAAIQMIRMQSVGSVESGFLPAFVHSFGLSIRAIRSHNPLSAVFSDALTADAASLMGTD